MTACASTPAGATATPRTRRTCRRPTCYQSKAGALCLPFANPRHSHEIDALRTQKLPDRMTLVCGVVETTHNYVEHPQVIAERLERAVRAVGDRESIMAG